MTTAAESKELTRVGPGTVMGELMRQYWIPAAMSSELVADGPPLRLMLLGEKLIGFRDSAGRVGVMDHRCPHRCASLFLARNEGNGLRCVYHGWKFDVAGRCVDMPSVPPHQDFKEKVRAKACQVTERAGIVWVYMGTAQQAPPFPQIEAALLPEEELTVVFAQRSCNYLQALEGDIDTSHFGFLHGGHVDATELAADNLLRYTVENRNPEYYVADSDWGTTYAAHRQAGDGRLYWRFANFLFPFWTQTPQGEFPYQVDIRAWVPMDDTHTMFVHISWNGRKRAIGTIKKDGLNAARLRVRPPPSAEHDRLAWPVAARRRRSERLGDRPRGAALQQIVLRHRQHPHAGPSGDGEHGADYRPPLRAPRAVRPNGHPDPAPAAAGGTCAAQQGRVAARDCPSRGFLCLTRRLLLHRAAQRLAGTVRRAAARRGATGREGDGVARLQ
jgi:phenylpropionate dioxygenase-like ring-hydroxylating dioxygenase large terminal subunit